jgi:inosine/xanthosine triphosphate pyrophosphatase family protein
VRRTAAGALGKLALDDDSRVEIANLNGIPKLLYIVANYGEDERETAANALTNLARNDMCRQIISSSSVKVEKRGENVTGRNSTAHSPPRMHA